jgi:exodeoxyribonuclease VIII
MMILRLLKSPKETLSMVKRAEWLPGMTNDQHHDGSAATSSFLKKILRSPAHALIPTESSPALEFGTMLHTAVLEPDEFEHNYMVAQECTAIKKSDKKKCTNAGVMIAASDGEWKCGVHSKGQHWHKGYANVETIDPADRDKCLFMRDSILNNPAARDVMMAEDAIKEVSGEVQLESGIILRIRPDIRVKSMGIIPDLKSTRDVRHDPFVKQCCNLGYHISAAMYRDVAEMIDGHDTYPTFWWIACEKEPPYACVVWECPADAMELGQMRYQEAIETYQKCLAEDSWDCYAPAGILEFPGWAWK